MVTVLHSTRKVARKAKVKVATWVYPSLHAKKKRGPRRRSKEINALKIAKQKDTKRGSVI